MKARTRVARVSPTLRERNFQRNEEKPPAPPKLWSPDSKQAVMVVKAARTIVDTHIGRNGTLTTIQTRLNTLGEVATDILGMSPSINAFEGAVRIAIRQVGRPPLQASRQTEIAWEARIIVHAQTYLYELKWANKRRYGD